MIDWEVVLKEKEWGATPTVWWGLSVGMGMAFSEVQERWLLYGVRAAKMDKFSLK